MQKAEEVAADVLEVADDTMLSQEMLRKYITFAKQNCHPRLANANVEKISEVSCILPVSSMRPDHKCCFAKRNLNVLLGRHCCNKFMVAAVLAASAGLEPDTVGVEFDHVRAHADSPCLFTWHAAECSS